MSKFIVLSGKKQSGKTTAANFLKIELEERNYTVHITSFASPIKDFCKDVVGLSEAQIYGSNEDKNSETFILWDRMPEEIRFRYGGEHTDYAINKYKLRPDPQYGYKLQKTGPMTAREVMQVFGTDIMRKFFTYDIWAKVPFNKYVDSTHDYVIIDDCRFPNEANMAIKYDAKLLRLQRDVLGDDQHISEKAMDDYPMSNYHMTIDNSTYNDITRLYADLNKFVSQQGIG